MTKSVGGVKHFSCGYRHKSKYITRNHNTWWIMMLLLLKTTRMCASFTNRAVSSPLSSCLSHSSLHTLDRRSGLFASSLSGDFDMKTVADHMLYRIRQCNRIPKSLKLVDFVVDDKIVGKVREGLVQPLLGASETCFVFDKDSNSLSLSSELTSSTSRTDAVMKVMKKLRSDGIINGWRDELLPVVTSFYDEEPVFLIERAAAPHLGTIQYGVHINGFVRGGNEGDLPMLWMARRSKTKSKYPGMLDHIVAGGQPFGITPSENVVKECEEEAGIPKDLAEKAVPVGAVSYEYSEEDGQVNRSVLFCYDIELPYDFQPTAVDGEVDEFFLRNLDQVLELMDPECIDPIKPNCYLVIIDFLLRKGILTPETPGYLDVLKELRSGDCV